MRDYREKKVSGFESDGLTAANCEVIVRMTSDEHGQTLSLQAPEYMIGIPLEAVKDIIEVVSKGVEA